MTNIVALAVKAYQIYWFLCLLAVSICSFVYLLLLIATPNNRIKQYEFKTRYMYIYNTLLSSTINVLSGTFHESRNKMINFWTVLCLTYISGLCST